MYVAIVPNEENSGTFLIYDEHAGVALLRRSILATRKLMMLCEAAKGPVVEAT
jgi:hypothetical protein